jgi:hypothetical protein
VLDNRVYKQTHTESSCLYRTSTVSKYFLLFHNDAHNHKITGILKQLKFRQSLRHVSVHARTIIREQLLCLAKITVMILYSRRSWRGQCHGSIPTCCGVCGTLPWHLPLHERREYRIITVILTKHKNCSLMMVPGWTETCRSDCRNFNCFNIPVILWLCASLWNNKKYFDTIWIFDTSCFSNSNNGSFKAPQY